MKIELKILELKKISKYLKYFLNEKKKIAILAISGIILMLIPGFFSKRQNEFSIKNVKNSENYDKRIQVDIENIVSKIEGAGKTKAMITFENETEIIYATEKRENRQCVKEKLNDDTILHKTKSGDSENKYITAKNPDGSERPLEITRIHPKTKGAVIVCEGAGIPSVRRKIIEAVSVALDIRENRICVTR
ncbi:MAG: hypothetical protein LBK29_02750 [Oscillospiraceae bacterium]|nr:hypothetical protein [Oscillospiraceae bacterium]